VSARFVTLEGGEGAGKSTILASVRERLEQQGVAVVVTREPGGTVLGEAIRDLALDPRSGAPCAESELLLMFAARAQLVREVIRPALARGAWVLSDRFSDASHAYQGGGRGQPTARIAELERWAADGLVPDLTLLLDLDVAAGRARVDLRNRATLDADAQCDRIEREDDGFFRRVRAAYLARAAAEPQRFRVIDASRTLETVRQDALAALDAWLAAEPAR
jgi:dTMP kinase